MHSNESLLKIAEKKVHESLLSIELYYTGNESFSLIINIKRDCKLDGKCCLQSLISDFEYGVRINKCNVKRNDAYCEKIHSTFISITIPLNVIIKVLDLLKHTIFNNDISEIDLAIAEIRQVYALNLDVMKYNILTQGTPLKHACELLSQNSATPLSSILKLYTTLMHEPIDMKVLKEYLESIVSSYYEYTNVLIIIKEINALDRFNQYTNLTHYIDEIIESLICINNSMQIFRLKPEDIFVTIPKYFTEEYITELAFALYNRTKNTNNKMEYAGIKTIYHLKIYKQTLYGYVVKKTQDFDSQTDDFKVSYLCGLLTFRLFKQTPIPEGVKLKILDFNKKISGIYTRYTELPNNEAKVNRVNRVNEWRANLYRIFSPCNSSKDGVREVHSMKSTTNHNTINK